MSKNIFTGNVDDELGPQVIRVTPNNEPVNFRAELTKQN